MLAYESVLPPISLAELEAYYDECKTLATPFGIPASALPADWSAFDAYNRAMWASDSLGVNTLSREMAHCILHGRGSWVPVPHWYRALTAAWMPDGLREAFALPYSEREERAAACALRWLPLFSEGYSVLSGMSGHIRSRVRVFRSAAWAFSLARAIASGWCSRECYSLNPNTKDLVSGIRSFGVAPDYRLKGAKSHVACAGFDADVPKLHALCQRALGRTGENALVFSK